jgi:hypothetical protein
MDSFRSPLSTLSNAVLSSAAKNLSNISANPNNNYNITPTNPNKRKLTPLLSSAKIINDTIQPIIDKENLTQPKKRISTARTEKFNNSTSNNRADNKEFRTIPPPTNTAAATGLTDRDSNTVTFNELDEFYCDEILPEELLFGAPFNVDNSTNQESNPSKTADLTPLFDNLLSKCYSLTCSNALDQNYQTALRASYSAALVYIQHLEQQNQQLEGQLNNPSNHPSAENRNNPGNPAIANVSLGQHDSVAATQHMPIAKESNFLVEIACLRAELSQTQSELVRAQNENLLLSQHYCNEMNQLTSAYYHQALSGDEQRRKFKEIFDARLNQAKQEAQQQQYIAAKKINQFINQTKSSNYNDTIGSAAFSLSQ